MRFLPGGAQGLPWVIPKPLSTIVANTTLDSFISFVATADTTRLPCAFEHFQWNYLTIEGTKFEQHNCMKISAVFLSCWAKLHADFAAIKRGFKVLYKQNS